MLSQMNLLETCQEGLFSQISWSAVATSKSQEPDPVTTSWSLESGGTEHVDIYIEPDEPPPGESWETAKVFNKASSWNTSMEWMEW